MILGCAYRFFSFSLIRGEKKVNSAALRKAAKEARQAEIERAREVKGVCVYYIYFIIMSRLPSWLKLLMTLPRTFTEFYRVSSQSCP